jgi:hypothetical protein
VDPALDVGEQSTSRSDGAVDTVTIGVLSLLLVVGLFLIVLAVVSSSRSRRKEHERAQEIAKLLERDSLKGRGDRRTENRHTISGPPRHSAVDSVVDSDLSFPEFAAMFDERLAASEKSAEDLFQQLGESPLRPAPEVMTWDDSHVAPECPDNDGEDDSYLDTGPAPFRESYFPGKDLCTEPEPWME